MNSVKRPLFPEVFLVELNSVLLKEKEKFLLKSGLPMVLRLSANVASNNAELGNADSECAIFFLPSEECVFGKILMNPFGGPSLKELERFGNGNSRRKREQEVDVIFHAADFESFHFVLAGDSTQEREQAFAKGGCELWPAVFRGENAMKVRGDVGHGIIFSRPFGTGSI